MAAKLMKYDLKSLFKSLLPFQLLAVGAAALVRIMYLFEKDTTVFAVIGGLSVTLLVIACMALLVMTFVFVIMRYYKNLFTAQGYLTFSLPVKPCEHFLSKLFSSFIVTFVSLGVVVLSVCIATMGELTVEIFRALDFYLKNLTGVFGNCMVCFVAEITVFVLIFIHTKYSLLFACISVGQMAKKKLLASVGAYFVYYFARQILGVIVIVAFSVKNGALMNIVQTFAEENPTVFGHVVVWGLIVIEAIFGIVCAFVAKGNITKRLNLE